MITYNIYQHEYGPIYTIITDDSNITPSLSTSVHPIKENITENTIIIKNLVIGDIYIFEQYKNILEGADFKHKITYIDCIIN